MSNDHMTDRKWNNQRECNQSGGGKVPSITANQPDVTWVMMHGSFWASTVLCSEFIFSQKMQEINVSMFCFIFCTAFNFPVDAMIRRTAVPTRIHSLCVLDIPEIRVT